MIPVAILALMLQTEPAHERTSFPRVLAWVACSKSIDEYTSARAVRLGAEEWNRLTLSTGERSAAALAATALASWAFYELERRPSKAWRIPRYLWAVGHLAIGVNNWRAGNRSKRVR